MSTATESFCKACEAVTKHEHGHCVECRAEELHAEQIRWMRTKRKALMIVTSVAAIGAINFLLASHYSGDDVARTALTSVVTGIATWFSTSKVSEDKV